MAEEQKDLTGILQYAQELEKQGKAPPVPKGAVLEQASIETIDTFESLEDYASANPVPEPSPEKDIGSFETTSEHSGENFSVTESPPSNPSEPESHGEISGQNAAPFDKDVDFPATDHSLPAHSSDQPGHEGQGLPLPDDFQLSEHTPDTPAFDLPDTNKYSEQPPPSTDAPANFDFSESRATATATPTPTSISTPAPESVPTEAPQHSSPTPDVPAQPSRPANSPPGDPPGSMGPGRGPLEKLKNYSEKLSTQKPSGPAAFPFSLLIQGPLRPEEKQKLIELVTQENMGIREIDLEPQLAAGRVLIPRISEFAGILLIQALRATRAQIKFGPSDSIFTSQASREDSDINTNPAEKATPVVETSLPDELAHPAENLPLTTGDQLPGGRAFTLIDLISASAVLKSKIVEAERSAEYHEIIEALQREIKYKAYRKGASAVILFKVQLNPLSSPTHYRILATGTAVHDKIDATKNI